MTTDLLLCPLISPRQPKIRVKHTPNALHPYTATMKGKGSYGWGNTPKEARERLAQQLALPTTGR